MSHKTTDLTTIRNRPGLFTWGRVEKIHDVGRYTIVEYMDDPIGNPPRASELAFHVYVDGKDTHTSAPTMDRALLVAISEGHMSGSLADAAAQLAAKMMGLP